MNQWVNSDILHMASDLVRQAKAIWDEDPKAQERRALLYEAVGHLNFAFAALESMPRVVERGSKIRL